MTTSNYETRKNFSGWLQRKINFGLTFKGLITFTIVWEFILILFFGSFSEPITGLLNIDPWLTLDSDPVEKAGRLVMLYHSIAVPFIAVCTYFVLEIMDVREKLKSRVKWPLFIGSMMTSVCGILFEYLFRNAWILHGLYLFGLSLTFYGGVMLLIGVFPTKKFPIREQDNKRNVLIGQFTLTILAICVLISVLIGAAIGAFFGNGLTVLLAEYFLRDYDHILYPTIFVDGIKAHLHVMLALIDAIILLVVFRYTVPDQKGKWYFTSMALAIPGILILSIGAWLVTFGDAVQQYFDPHYLIYVGSAVLVFVGLILAFTGWKKTIKEHLGNSYESASLLTRIRAVFKDPVKFALYFQFIWVNLVMTFAGIFLALSLRDDSVLTERLNLISFRSGPLAVETTVARGHWHVLAVLSAVILLLLFIDLINIQGIVRKVIGWLLFAGSLIAFAPTVIYMYLPHLDQTWAQNESLYPDVLTYWNTKLPFLPAASMLNFIIDLGIMLFVIAITVFCFHQLIEILKGKKDVAEFPE